MADTAKLAQELAGLDDADFFLVLEEVETKRREKALAVDLPDLNPKATDLEFAQWLARQQFAFDPGTREIVYLPKGAPPKEIRLVSVNVLLAGPDETQFEPYDYPTNTEGMEFQVAIVDLTPEQWIAVQRKPQKLPSGWQVEGCIVFGRNSAA